MDSSRFLGTTRASLGALGLSTLVAVLAGCGRAVEPVAPGAGVIEAEAVQAGARFPGDPLGERGPLASLRGLPYPLAVGNRWEYRIRANTRIVSPGTPDVVFENESPWTAEITGTASVEGRSYFLQEEYDPRVLRVPGGLRFAMRQDRSGLFERDIALRIGSTVPARACDAPTAGVSALRSALATSLAGHPRRAAFERAGAELEARLRSVLAGPPGGGPDPGEITHLRYPLRVGARWVVRESPGFSRHVVGRERLLLRAGSFVAWRILGGSELFGPADHAMFWYAGSGLVRIRFHGESDATDESGNVVGRVIHDTDQRLVAVTLLEDGGPLQ